MNIGIIGGADGPTAVLVSLAIPMWLVGALIGAVIAIAAVIIVLLVNKH